MAPDALIDNDIAIKGSCYDLLAPLLQRLGGPGTAGVLGTARFVVRRQLERNPLIHDRATALARWIAFLAAASELEPTDAEIAFATAIEEAAAKAALALDGGESLLCAIAVTRAVPLILTGDKRAVEGVECLAPQVPGLGVLANTIACLEQLMLWMANNIGGVAARAQACAEPDIDKAISICFECTGHKTSKVFNPVGLQSYIIDLQSRAPTMLRAGVLFP